MRTRSSPSLISSSAMPELSTNSISVLSLRKSMVTSLSLVFMVQCELHREFIACRAQAADHANGEIGKERFLAKRLAREHIGKMYFLSLIHISEPTRLGM